MRAPSTKDYVLMMLALLMSAHLGVLGFAAVSCDERSDRGQQIGPVCTRVGLDLQQAVETYIAVILALLAPISTVD